MLGWISPSLRRVKTISKSLKNIRASAQFVFPLMPASPNVLIVDHRWQNKLLFYRNTTFSLQMSFWGRKYRCIEASAGGTSSLLNRHVKVSSMARLEPNEAYCGFCEVDSYTYHIGTLSEPGKILPVGFWSPLKSACSPNAFCTNLKGCKCPRI